jgi:hypothetical protein
VHHISKLTLQLNTEIEQGNANTQLKHGKQIVLQPLVEVQPLVTDEIHFCSCTWSPQTV